MRGAREGLREACPKYLSMNVNPALCLLLLRTYPQTDHRIECLKNTSSVTPKEKSTHCRGVLYLTAAGRCFVHYSAARRLSDIPVRFLVYRKLLSRIYGQGVLFTQANTRVCSATHGIARWIPENWTEIRSYPLGIRQATALFLGTFSGLLEAIYTCSLVATLTFFKHSH